jgi:catalase-peroxidase
MHGTEDIGFGFGREDIWHPEKDTYWGAEKEWLAEATDRYDNGKPDLAGESAGCRRQMGLIYVNPEGVHGKPDPARRRRSMCARPLPAWR